MSTRLYGLLAEFEGEEKLLSATAAARRAGFRQMDAYAPYPVKGIAAALGRGRTWVPALVLTGGILGGAGGYFMEWYAMAVDYPINIGGRPFNSWPLFIPITFELTVLTAAIFAIVSMLGLNRLPQPWHPLFSVPEFERASQDGLFLCIESSDPKFNSEATRQFLEKEGALQVIEVPHE